MKNIKINFPICVHIFIYYYSYAIHKFTRTTLVLKDCKEPKKAYSVALKVVSIKIVEHLIHRKTKRKPMSKRKRWTHKIDLINRRILYRNDTKKK